MKTLIYALLAAAGIAIAVSCSDGSTIGNSLVDESIVIVVDSSFTVSSATVPIDSVQSRTITQLLGNIDARGFGSISSDFVGQFMPSNNLDTTNILNEEIDSVKLFMQMVRGAYVGDSLVPMGLTVYKLNKDLPYPIFSNFNPEGYYDPADVLCDGIYSASTMSEVDSIKDLKVVYTTMKMPKQFGMDLLQAYRKNPEVFSDPEAFARDVFKGVYIRSSFGSGRITDFTTTSIRFYFRKSVYNEDSLRYDTLRYVGDYFAITPEVVVNNNIRYNVAPELSKLVSDGNQILAAPLGYELEMRFPAPEIVKAFRNAPGNKQVLNTLSFSIPVETIENDYNIAPPPFVLLVLKSKKEEFFASNSLADNITSFYAAYDETNRCYSFTSMRAYLSDLLSKENITEEDYTFVLTPVEVNMESSAGLTNYYYYGNSSYVVSSIVPYVSTPVMAKILVDKAKIKLTFSSNDGKMY